MYKSFVHLYISQLHFNMKKMQGWGFVYLPSLLYPPLFVLFIGMLSLHLFSFLMIFVFLCVYFFGDILFFNILS